MTLRRGMTELSDSRRRGQPTRPVQGEVESPTQQLQKELSTMAFTLPDLPYAVDALEPHIDARTMEIHHGKHHATM